MPRKPDFIIGHDMSLTDSGVTILRADGTIEKTVSIKTDGRKTPHDHARIDYIAEQYFDLINPYVYKSEVAAIFEDIMFSGKQSGKAGARFELLGLLRWNLRQQHIRIVGITPSAWVSKVIYPYKVPRASDARKQAVNRACEDKYKFFTKNLNISDSLGIAMCGYFHFIQGQKLSIRSLSQG